MFIFRRCRPHTNPDQRRIMRQIIAGESDHIGDIGTVAEPGVVDVITQKVAESG